MFKFLYFSCFLFVFSLMLGLFCTAFMLKWNNCMVILNRVTTRRLPHGPLFRFLLQPLFCFLPACFNFVIACRLYCFNVDACVFFIFGKKLWRAYVFCLYYMPNWNKVLLTYVYTCTWVKCDVLIPILQFVRLRISLHKNLYVPYPTLDHFRHPTDI